MIKDLALMNDISPLFEKKIVIWGMGKCGRTYLQDILEMGAGKQGIYLCDSNQRLWGDVVNGFTIASPQNVCEGLNGTDLREVIILIAVRSVNAQEEIIAQTKRLYGEEVWVCTEYGVKWGIYFCLKNPKVDEKYRERKRKEHQINKSMHNEYRCVEILKYFAFLPLYDDEIILIYQPGKVASSAVYIGIQEAGHNVLHVHNFAELRGEFEQIYNISNMKSAKIISMVREPLARQISEMWENIVQISRYSAEVDMDEIYRYYFRDGFENREFQWFDEMKCLFHIDVFAHPFDREKGYTIIKEGNIELLLMTAEKISGLESVIGQFVGIDDFKLPIFNRGDCKSYRYAYAEFKDTFIWSKEILDRTYKSNEYMKHFFTGDQLESFYKKWSN